MHGPVDLSILVSALCTAAVALTALLRRLFHAIHVMNKVWDLVSRELQPNGGGSTYDRVADNSEQLRIQSALLLEHMTNPEAHKALMEKRANDVG